MRAFFKRIISAEQGQDLIEYTLLLAFVALASAALFAQAGGSVEGIWSKGDATLVKANTAATLQRRER
jgi:Flp pilus assembly pilin Flp